MQSPHHINQENTLSNPNVLVFSKTHFRECLGKCIFQLLDIYVIESLLKCLERPGQAPDKDEARNPIQIFPVH